MEDLNVLCILEQVVVEPVYVKFVLQISEEKTKQRNLK